jgi:hypothetical protein
VFSLYLSTQAAFSHLPLAGSDMVAQVGEEHTPFLLLPCTNSVLALLAQSKFHQIAPSIGLGVSPECEG